MKIDAEKLKAWLEEMATEYRRLASDHPEFSATTLAIWEEKARLCDLVADVAEGFECE